MGRRPGRSKSRPDQDASRIEPTAERRRQGPVEELPQPIADDTGAAALPWRAIDILASLERRDAITPEMREAGEDFRRLFRSAHLDELRAADMARIPRAGGGKGNDWATAEQRREAVRRAIIAAGGIGSPAGSCLWHVVGAELSLKEWALRRGWAGHRMRQEVATGVLITALGVLAMHLGRTKTMPPLANHSARAARALRKIARSIEDGEI